MGRPIQGWDPVLLISQIISLQTIHYLLLSLLVPPLLSILTDPTTLTYSGGAYSSAYVMDWREMASKSTAGKWIGREAVEEIAGMMSVGGGVEKRFIDRDEGGEIWATDHAPSRELQWNQTQLLPSSSSSFISTQIHSHLRPRAPIKEFSPDWDPDTFDYGVDNRRGWILGGIWILVCGIDILPIYLLIRKPTHVLDFSLTLAFLHICFTTYHTGGRFPFSFFFWMVLGGGSLVMIVGAEQLCVRREMNQTLKAAGWESAPLDPGLSADLDEIEMAERG